jgi:hypothetical protein
MITQTILEYFKNNNCIKQHKLTKYTSNIFRKIYFEINNGVEYVNNLKKELRNNFYNYQIMQINSINDIPKPKTFSQNAFPEEIRNYIDNNMFYFVTYNIDIIDRNIKIIFILENQVKLTKYNNYVDWMLVWLYIMNEYSTYKCAPQLTIYIYHTSLLKQLPDTNITILNENHVNTAFTRTCPINSEIVVFRYEEWFKVFMHETFHNFGLDFSDMNNTSLHENILTIFPVSSDINLFEAYTEFWARIMNSLFCSYFFNEDKNNINNFLNYSNFFINMEIKYSYFQVVKILNFMGLNYENLYEQSYYSQIIRNNLYKENSSVLSYYIITLILLNNYQEFINWCETNNTSLLQFKKTVKNQNNLYEFIKKKYKTKSLLDGLKCIKRSINNIQTNKTNKKEFKYLLSNLRMTLCEFM